MSRSAFGSMLLLVVLQPGGILGADKSPTAENPPQVDFSKFPKINGKVVQVLGSSFGYIPPRVGDEMELDLKTISQLEQLRFKSRPGDFSTRSYIPLATSDKPAGAEAASAW